MDRSQLCSIGKMKNKTRIKHERNSEKLKKIMKINSKEQSIGDKNEMKTRQMKKKTNEIPKEL